MPQHPSPPQGAPPEQWLAWIKEELARQGQAKTAAELQSRQVGQPPSQTMGADLQSLQPNPPHPLNLDFMKYFGGAPMPPGLQPHVMPRATPPQGDIPPPAPKAPAAPRAQTPGTAERNQPSIDPMMGVKFAQGEPSPRYATSPESMQLPKTPNLDPNAPDNYGKAELGWGFDQPQPLDLGDGGGGGGMFGSMTPQDWLGVAGLGIGGIGAIANAKQQGKQFNQQMDLQRQQMAQNATQLNPYKQQGDLAALAMKRAMAVGGPSFAQFGTATPTAGARPMLAEAANKYLSDEALAGAKTNFDTQLQGSQQQALQNALQPEKKKGGFWRKFGKIASMVAPIVAAPFTGGASLALIGAGAGAANSALSGGGWKGALMGAGLGAIPGGGGLPKGAVAPTLRAGLGQAAKKAINPRTVLQMALR